MKTKRILNTVFFTLAVGLLLNLSGCIHDNFFCVNGSGPVVTEARHIEGFEKIDLQNSANIFVEQDDRFSVEVEGQANVLSELRTRLKGDVLVVDYDDCVNTHEPVNIYLKMPHIEGLKITGSGRIIGQGHIASESLELRIPGSGKIILDNLEAGSIYTTIVGSGDIEVSSLNTSHLTNYHYIEIAGSGDIYTYNLPVNDVKIDIIGSGNCYVNATSTLDIEILGSGNIFYIGYPDISQHILGSGNIYNEN